MFQNRIEAGKQLGAALMKFQTTHPLILGIPRGGVAVGYEAARLLNAKFNILIVRKLAFPNDPEAGFGAIAEDGSRYFIPDIGRNIPHAYVDLTIQQQQAEVIRRVKALRNGQPLPDLAHHHVIIVDDGIAMGSTMQAAILCCRNSKAGRITVATPVASPGTIAALKAAADDVISLLSPPAFHAVAEFYQDWYDVPDKEVVDIMKDVAAKGLLAVAQPHQDPTRSV